MKFKHEINAKDCQEIQEKSNAENFGKTRPNKDNTGKKYPKVYKNQRLKVFGRNNSFGLGT